ncbi:MAG: hypothetical protein HQK79_06945 [Desulfobacterales bacterium]|nr:hypothetical protein [Desulfobacterales bacterium]MBF0397533.1 hypothetical protein [Desulfobacterales bacterium]
MQIANPIYDVVFKYLMEDNKVAKLFLSTIIGKKIEKLSFKPQERVVNPQQRSFTVYRLDFSAKIKTKEGDKLVIIEIQKAKFATDIMRFRKYLGDQYQNKDNIYTMVKDKERIKVALPIISIYFLGHKLRRIKNSVIRVERKYYDNITGEEIKSKEDFIESLTHDSYIIQIPTLTEKRRTELEILLSVFDQSNRSENSHIMNVKEEDFPEKYRDIIRRLQRAVAEQEVRDTMDIEDEILEELEDKERYIFKQIEIIEKKDKALEKNKKAIEEKDKALEEKDKALEENKKAIEEKDKFIEEIRRKLEKIELEQSK